MRCSGSAALAASLALGLLAPSQAPAQQADWASAISEYNNATYFTRAPLKSDEIERCAQHWERWHQAIANGEVPAAQLQALPVDMRERSQELARGWRELAGPQLASSTTGQEITNNRLTRAIAGENQTLKLFFYDLAGCRPMILTETKARSAPASNPPQPPQPAPASGSAPIKLCDQSQIGVRHGFAGSEDWFITNQPIFIDGKRYEKYGLPRQLGSSHIQLYTSYRGAEVYVRHKSGSMDELFVLTGAVFGFEQPHDCLYQAYRRN